VGLGEEDTDMTKQPSTTKPKPTSKAGPATNREPRGKEQSDEPKEDLVVFAFRLTPKERDMLHKAAGPAKASRYVRTLAVAAASGDKARVEQLLGTPADPVN
jgi:hypothetical protein